VNDGTSTAQLTVHYVPDMLKDITPPAINLPLISCNRHGKWTFTAVFLQDTLL